MRHHKNGFGTTEVIIIIFMVGALVFASRHFWAHKTIVTIPPPRLMTVTLTDRTTHKPLANTAVEFNSVNDTTCIQPQGCPNNPKAWKGTTDANGSIKIDPVLLQEHNTIFQEQYNADGSITLYPVANFNETGTAETDSSPVRVHVTF